VISCSKFIANRWENENNSLDLEFLGNGGGGGEKLFLF